MSNVCPKSEGALHYTIVLCNMQYVITKRFDTYSKAVKSSMCMHGYRYSFPYSPTVKKNTGKIKAPKLAIDHL